MYETYWKLERLPFENTPDPQFLWASSQHQEGLARLSYVVEQRKGAGLLTGVFGCGKTLLARSLLKQLPESRYRIAYLANPLMSEMDLLHGIAEKLHISNLPDRRSDVLMDVLLSSIEQTARENARDGKDTVVVIDEAHVIKDERVIDELRLLLNFQDEDRFLITMILMGQPELKDMIDRHKPLAQRIFLGHHLVPLNESDTALYIQHRLAVAGGRAEIFSGPALRAVFQHSGGIPRRINQVSDMALLTGMGANATQLDEAMIQEVVGSLGV